MYDEKKVKRVRLAIAVVSATIIFIIGLAIGSSVNSSKNATAEKPKETKVIEKETTLSAKTVERFLIAYYTKKDLGENRKRYEPLVTTTMLNDLISTENEPVNQAYKGYIVDQVFEDADIYVDTTNSSAIAMVNYKNTQLATKGSYENALENQSHQEAIKLTFLKQGKSFLVNRLDYVSLTQPLSQPRNTYKTTDNVEGVQSIEQTTEEKEALDKATQESKAKEEAKKDESTKESK